MHLKEFFGTLLEEHVMSEFGRMQKEYGNIFFQFYENDLEIIAKFVKKYEDIFKFKTKIYNTEAVVKDFCWFYIYDEEKTRGEYKFCCKTNVVSGLKEFEKTLKFVLTPNSKNPHKTQKRNDHEDSNWN